MCQSGIEASKRGLKGQRGSNLQTESSEKDEQTDVKEVGDAQGKAQEYADHTTPTIAISAHVPL
jgi:hypothetical protein